MENVYKVKIKSNRDPRSLYPSERRYSASIVLGLSICHLFFSALTLILAILAFISEPHSIENFNAVDLNISNRDVSNPFFLDEIEENKWRENIADLNSVTKFYLILTTLLLMIGCLLAGLAGLLAWKRWYMDNNIKWFFGAALLASFLSTVSIICAIITVAMIIHGVSALHGHPQVKIHVHVHILIASVLELIFAITSTVISYTGMRRNYPDDIVMPKGTGKIVVNTVMKGNKKYRISPPDIINHFNVAEKFAKYFPKKDSGYLPKAESNLEYEERVRKFLSSNGTDNSMCKT